MSEDELCNIKEISMKEIFYWNALRYILQIRAKYIFDNIKDKTLFKENSYFNDVIFDYEEMSILYYHLADESKKGQLTIPYTAILSKDTINDFIKEKNKFKIV